MSFVWTSDVVEKARRLYILDGYSAAETARRIGASRSAVIGKAHRMGWAEDRPPALAYANLVRANRLGAERDRPRPLSRRPPPADLGEAETSAPRPWKERAPGQCAWPVAGEGEHVLSCCAPSGRDSYCPAHRQAMHPPRAEGEAQELERMARWIERREGPRAPRCEEA